ncbi:glycosyltransferase [Nesterenkonia lutea]|uniref:UDP-N-acetylglucosamine transferase subunit ALG13 n=1 Tax=Nesterenkonia lutea TaxID=272919 RepID=A0ABR9JDY4_9MICC|nr:glycosyltransferase [Nesterenkonia lutea]MBE1524139.1 UDP-N-acetylglucosamine transferase subunit ALG13 [Nesterenkonia lutea]
MTYAFPELAGQRALLVASTGGHLEQLVQLEPVLGVSPQSQWMTFDSPQSRSLLAGRDATIVPYIASRDWRGVIRAASEATRLDWDSIDVVVSTGAALALSVFPVARLRRTPAFYIESVSRFDGPSLTGRLTQRLRLATTFTQHAEWATDQWQYRYSVLSAYEAAAEPLAEDFGISRIFVTLGTIRPFRFDALVDAVLAAAPEGAEIVWQLGETDRTDLPGKVHRTISVEDFDREAMHADVVVTHAGVGSTLRLLELGISPVLVPRRKARGEHIDDHQTQVASQLAAAGLLQRVDAPDLELQHLLQAAATRVHRTLD